MIVLRAIPDAAAVPETTLRELASNRLEFMQAEDLLGGDTPSIIVIVEEGDPTSALSGELGFDVLRHRYCDSRFDEPGYCPTFEVVEEHPDCFEMVFVLSDYGDGVIALVPKREGIDPQLLAMCAMYAAPATQGHV